MVTMLYNYIFYLTVRILNWCSNNLIVKPLISIFKMFSISKKRIQNVKKSHLIPTDSYDNNSTNILYAFSLMMWSLTCVFFTIGLLTIQLLVKTEIENILAIIFWTAVILSIIINYLSLWKSDRYINYFRQFKQQTSTNRNYLVALIYHSSITIICILTAINY